MLNENRPVPDDVQLYRRLHPKQVIWDTNQQSVRATSDAFADRELSVGLEDALVDNELEPAWMLRLDPLHQLGRFVTGFARSEQQDVRRDPLRGHERYGDDPAHGVVVGPKPKARRRLFAANCTVLVLQPDGLSADVRTHLLNARGTTADP